MRLGEAIRQAESELDEQLRYHLERLVDLGRALFEAAIEPKEFWTISGADHINLIESARVEHAERLSSFYETI